MTTFALIHGSGDGGWSWHLVQEALIERGHDSVAPDLPTDRTDATWEDCVVAVADAVGSTDDVVVVGHSSGGFVSPLVADRLRARMQVFLAGMVPQPGETGSDWFGNVGWSEPFAEQARSDGGLTGHEDPMIAFYHDVPPGLAAQAMARERPVGESLGESPWPLAALPSIPARSIVTTRDRFIPASVQRRVAAERLAICEPDELVAGHCANLAKPAELADILASYVD